MFERLGYFLSLEAYILGRGVVLSVEVLLLGVLAGALIWLLQRRRCGVVCTPLHDKPGKVWGLIPRTGIYQPPLGVLAYFAWPLVLALNVLFAATVLDIFFSGTRRIVAPWAPEAGQYYALALIAGLLLAAGQSILGILFGVLGEIRSRHQASLAEQGDADAAGVGERRFDPRIWVGILIGASVVFQIVMAMWRANQMAIGMDEGLPGFWQGLLSQGGIYVAGLLGLIIPVLEVVLGYLAFHWLLVPWLGVVLAGALWAAVGWHPHTPAAVDRLRREVARVEKRARKLEKTVSKLHSAAQGMVRPPCPSEVDAEVAVLDNEIREACAKWDATAAELDERSAGARTPPELNKLGRAAWEAEVEVTRQRTSLLAKLRGLRAGVARLRKACLIWNAIRTRIVPCDTNCKSLKTDIERWQKVLSESRTLLKWSGKGEHPDILEASSQLGVASTEELIRLIKASISPKAESHEIARTMLANAGEALDNADASLKRAAASFSVSEHLLYGTSEQSGLAKRFQSEAAIPSGQQIAGWRHQLTALQRYLIMSRVRAVRNLRRIRRECRLKTVPWWSRFLEALLPEWLLKRKTYAPVREEPRSSRAAGGSESEPESVDRGGSARSD